VWITDYDIADPDCRLAAGWASLVRLRGAANANVIDPKRLGLWGSQAKSRNYLPRGQAGFMLHGVNFRQLRRRRS